MNTGVKYVLTASIAAVCMVGTANAQSQTGSTSSGTTTTTSTTDQGTATAGSTINSSQTSSSYNDNGFGGDHSWFGSALVGSSFAQSADDANLNLGASIGYLFRQAVGVEFAADFSPKFVVAQVPLGENQVNSYMVNLVGAVPIGSSAMVQPFVEGGLGAITLRSDQTQFGGPAAPGIDDNQFAFNLGAGVMGFKNHWGVRADVRYVRAVGNEDNATLSGLDDNGNFQISNVDFWRTNVGVAFRW